MNNRYRARRLFTGMLVAITFAALAGCSSTPLKDIATDPLGITLTVGLVLDQSDNPQELAKNIVAGIEDARKLIADGEVSTVDSLTLALNRKIADSNLSPTRKVALYAVLTRLASIVGQRLSEGNLSGDDIVYLGQILNQLDAAVMLYYPEISRYGVAQGRTV